MVLKDKIHINKEKITTILAKVDAKLNKHKSIRITTKIAAIISATVLAGEVGYIGYNGIIRPTILTNKYNIYSNRKLKISEEEKANIIKNFEKRYNIKIKSRYNDSVFLFDSIFKNKNLTDKEKRKFYSIADLIEDNPYINKEKAYTNLLNLDINYEKDLGELSGYWNGIDMHIEKTSDKSWKEHVMIHEAIHAIYDDTNSDKPNFITEGMCELLTSEYNTYPYTTYNEYINMVKMLCEIVGSDAVLKSYSTDNMDYIYNEMAKIKGNYNDAKDLIDNIDDLTTDIWKEELEIEDKKELKDNLLELREYYTLKKYNKEDIDINKEEDFYDNYYMNLIKIIDKMDKYYIPKVHKAYFNSHYTRQSSRPYIEKETGKSK